VLSHLLFGGQTLTKLVKYEIGANRRHTANKNNEHPFHGSAYGVRIRLAPAFLPVTRRTVVTSPADLAATAPAIVAMPMTSSPTMTPTMPAPALHFDQVQPAEHQRASGSDRHSEGGHSKDCREGYCRDKQDFPHMNLGELAGLNWEKAAMFRETKKG
jgi:hypothetical protein